MYRTVCVLALVALCAGLAHSFSWEIVKGVDSRLEFVDLNGTIVHTEEIEPSNAIYRIIYDPVHKRVLFSDLHSIFSFDITTKKTKFLLTTNDLLIGLAYDPATELLFWIQGEDSQKMYSIPLKPESDISKHKKHFILSQKFTSYVPAIAVDSCGGFIYYTSYYKIKKVRFDGSGNEVVINNDGFIDSLTIDQQAQKVYFTDTTPTIKSADLDGKNLRTILAPTHNSDKLIVSKDFMYWVCYDAPIRKRTIKQLPKNLPLGEDVIPKHFTDTERIWNMAAYWNINDIIPQEIQNCDNLKSLLPNNSVSTDESLFCVHGKKVDGESRCECAYGYRGTRCTISVCHNYCLYGDCSTNNIDDHPKCRCNAGHTGERCEVEVCRGYCLNGGLCSLSENGTPLCRCTGHYEGERCDVPLFQTKFLQAISLLKDILNTDVTSTSTSASTDF